MVRLLAISAASAVVLSACGTDPVVRSFQADDDVSADVVDAGDGAGAEDTGTARDIVDDAPDTIHPPTRPSTLGDCEPQTQWTSPEPSYLLVPSYVGFVDGDALVLNGMWQFGSAVLRADDGEDFGWPLTDTVLDVTPDDARALLLVDDRLVMRDLSTDAELWASDVPTWQVVAASMSSDGGTVAVITCTDTGATEVRAQRAIDGAAQTWTLADGSCWGYGYTGDAVLVAREGDILLGGHGDGTLYRFDLASGSISTVEAHPEPGDDDGMPGTPAVLAVAVHPDGDVVATSGADGRVRRWRLPDLTTVGEPLRSSWHHINLNTYAPQWLASPVAWSPDGTLLACVGEDGRPTLHDERTHATHTRLERIDATEEELLWDEAEGAVAALAFSPAGDALVTIDMLGTRLYACAPPAPRADEESL